MRTPPLVVRAMASAEAAGFDPHYRPEDGALIHVLAGRRGLVRAGELGAGCGLAAAWIVSALPPSTPFVTAERDPRLATVARQMLADDPQARVLVGDWRDVMPPEAPFDLLRVGVADATRDPYSVIGLMAPGGTIVVNDPSAGHEDPFREAWLCHPELSCVAVGTGGSAAALLAVRR